MAHASVPTVKPAVLVARRIFPEVLARLRQHFDVEANETDDVWSAG
jgi:gluconate 2-dehydrogenase